MALWMMIVRKMVKNKWLELSLLLGLVITVALVSSMPVYTEAILTRMLVKDLERQQTNSHTYPGAYYTSIMMAHDAEEENRRDLTDFAQYMKTEASDGFRIPVQQLVAEFGTGFFKLVPADGNKADAAIHRSGELRSVSGIMEHIRLVDGRLPAKEPVDGVYEALVTQRTLGLLESVLGSVFEVKDEAAKETIKIMPVGVFEKKHDDDLFFRVPTLYNFERSLIIDEDLFERDFIQGGKFPLGEQHWYFLMDYTKLTLRHLDDFLDNAKEIEQRAGHLRSGLSFMNTSPTMKLMESYPDRAANLKTLMWSLNVPVLIMLGIYMFMVSNLITERQKNEIAVLRSRGASRLQIILSFTVEGTLLCGAALAVGPFAGLYLTKLLGASNGFLEFVNRSSLTVLLSGEAFRYAGIAALCSLIMMLIPVFLAARVSVVGHKQNLSRSFKTPIWHKLYLDVIAIGVSLYGLRVFHSRMKTLQSYGLDKDMMRIDPLQFLIPALFILGSGFLLLRLYPYLLRMVYWVGRKWWLPSLYATLIQLGRSGSQYQFLMIFLIMTVATGIFSASAARTINNNSEDRVRYGNGADLVLDVPWNNDAPPEASEGSPFQAAPAPKRIHYEEPPFEPYQSLPGVEQAARVFVKDTAQITAGKEKGTVTLVGIKTDELAGVAWFRDGLLEHSFYDYLNLLAENPRAVLISRSVAEQKQVKAGDPIWIGWDGVDSKAFIVYGIIDYFPTFNPQPASFDSKAKDNKPMLVVGHLRQIQTSLALEPYQLWLKLKPGSSAQEVYQGITDRNLKVAGILNTEDDLVLVKNDPFLMAINGVMTLGFLISIVVSFVGFLLYWILTLSGRALQTGILRALGMRLPQLIGMLGAEQLLTSGAAVMIGVLAGHVTSRLFVPLFETAFDPAKLVPPFQVMFDPTDSIRLYTIVALMMTIGLCILGWMLSRIKIHQALKLGED